MGSGPIKISREQLSIPPGSLFSRLPLIGGVVGVLGLVASFLLYGNNHEQFYYSWLVSFMFFLSIALGGLFFVLAHYVTKAGWGVVVRRLSENTMATLPLFALLFLPIYFGIHELFHWSHADAVAHDQLLQSKEPFLNEGFFTARAALYFIVWSLLAVWFARNSHKQDSSGDHAITRKLIFVSGPAIFLFAISVSFAAIDWLMSLDPHWYSTIFGVYYFAGCLVGIFAFMVLLASALSRAGYLEGVVTTEHFHDLGKLLFAFTVFWAYIAFSQFFLIWYGNIPEETLWYMHRAEGNWKNVTLLLAVGHFAVPFLFLMSRHIKRRTGLLVAGALWMLFIHYVDIYWLVMPVLHHHGAVIHPLDVTTFFAIGGIFVGAVGWMLRRHCLVPIRDPRMAESLSFQNF